VSSYVLEGVERLVVATATTVARTTPDATWELVRDGAIWRGQLAHDLDGDGREEIVGFDPDAHDLCVIDPGASVPVPACLHLTTKFEGEDVTIIAGANLTQNPGLDVLVGQGGGEFTLYTLVEDFTYFAGTSSAAMVRPLGPVGPPRGRTAIARPSPSLPPIALSMGTEGGTTCVLGPC
jgi:hypothetical protein